jgi:hypothetical protein
MEDGRLACVLGQVEGAPKSVTYCTSATAGKVSCCFVASSPSFCGNGLIIRHEGRHQDGKQASSPGRLMLCRGVVLGSRCQPLAGHYSPSCSTGCAGLGSREAQTHALLAMSAPIGPDMGLFRPRRPDSTMPVLCPPTLLPTTGFQSFVVAASDGLVGCLSLHLPPAESAAFPTPTTHHVPAYYA